MPLGLKEIQVIEVYMAYQGHKEQKDRKGSMDRKEMKD